MKSRLIFGILGLMVTIQACQFFSSSPKNQTEIVFAETAKVDEQIQQHPKDASLYFKRAVIYRKLEQDSLALLDLYKAVSLDSTKSNYHSAIGQILFDHKDISGSTIHFQKALAIDPDDEIAHLKMAKLFLFTGEYPKSFTEINTVLRRNVYNAEAYFLKGMCYKNMKDTLKAISSFQTSVQTDPKFGDAHMQLALIYEAKKDKLALQYFENAYRADPSNMEALYGQGMFWQNQEKYEEAKQVYTRMVMVDRNYPKSYYNKGWILLQQDSTEKAMRQFDLAIQVEPNYAEAYYNRGICKEILGKNEDAGQDYQQALNLSPDAEPVKQALQRVQKNLKK